MSRLKIDETAIILLIVVNLSLDTTQLPLASPGKGYYKNKRAPLINLSHA